MIEKERQIPVAGEYDVIVSGGGIAGVAAAIASARAGAKTLLIEKMYMLGGLATAGLVTIYLPLCDGKGTQVSFGLAEELLKLSVTYGFEPGPDDETVSPWLRESTPEERLKRRYRVRFNAQVYAILCEQMLRKTGVDILYGTSICAAAVENSKVTAVITENKSGRQAYMARSFVDATGDADLCALAGEKTATYQQGNVLAGWYYELVDGKYKLHMVGTADKPNKYKTAEQRAADTRTRYTGLDGREISQLLFDSHDTTLAHFLKNGGISADHALATMATFPQLRMTRRVEGPYELDDTEMFKSFPDSIGMVSDWRKSGPVYEIPFRCLYGKTIKNVITCGRCISVTDAMWDITRVIPDCAVTGEAAGLAAAISDDFGKLDVSVLQQRLRENGVKLHLKDVGLQPEMK